MHNLTKNGTIGSILGRQLSREHQHTRLCGLRSRTHACNYHNLYFSRQSVAINRSPQFIVEDYGGLLLPISSLIHDI